MKALVVVVVVSGSALAAPGLPPQVFPIKSVTASSTYAGKGYEAWRVVENTHERSADLTGSPPNYSWCEGKKDEGIGEGITIELYEPTKIDHITLSPGVQRTEKLFAKNNQITKVTVSADDKSQTVTLTPKYGATVDVKIDAKVTKLGITIAAVTKGKDNDSCLSEVTIASPGAAEVAVPLVVGISPAAWGKLGPVLDALIKKQAPNGDPDDERGYRVDGKGPGVVTITFPAHSDTLEQWTMEWKNEKWTRKSIGKEEW